MTDINLCKLIMLFKESYLWRSPRFDARPEVVYFCKVSKVLKMVLFADDTNLYCSGNSF